MEITKETVEYIAHLARLELSSEEKIKYTEQLNKILKYMEKLNKIDTTGVIPTAYVLKKENIFRQDRVEESLPVEKVLENAYQKEKNYFKVKRVIE